MKQIKQFRYYYSGSTKNYPANFQNYYNKLINGNIFEKTGIISHLGIQGVPGTKFYLNNSSFPIVIGSTGIYELDLGVVGQIHSIKFDANTLNAYYTSTSQTRLLIDIVYDGGQI